jgi:hypothetical protein
VSHQVNEILGQILLIVFFAVAGAMPLVILALSILNFSRYAPRRTAITLKALAALAIWACLTFILVMVFIMVVFQFPAYKSQANETTGTVIFTVGTLIYALAGAALIYWMKRQSKRSPVVAAS